MVDVRPKDLPAGAYESGEKIATDSTVNGTRQIDLDDVTAGVLAGIRNLTGGAFVGTQQVALDSAGTGTRRISLADLATGVLETIRDLPLGTATAGEKLVTDSAGNGARQIDVQDLIDAVDAVLTADNGLTRDVAGNVQLGGDLITNTAVGQLGSGVDLAVIARAIGIEADGLGGLLLRANTENVVVDAVLSSIVLQAVAGLVDIQALALNAELTAGSTIESAGDNTIRSTTGAVVLDASTALKVLTGGPPAVGDILEASNVDGSLQWVTPDPTNVNELYLSTGSPGTTFTVVTAGTPVQITGLTTGADIGPNTIVSDRVVIAAGQGGTYEVHCSMSFSGTASAEVSLGVIKNSSGAFEPNLQQVRKLGVGGDVGAAGFTGYLSVNAGDTVEVAVDSDNNGDNVNIWYLNLSVVKED